ncbi:MAG: hypothetical protein RBU21_17320 [FCB group bacterium]|jgi:hypothetical protein|nr:hypothetical protein [FCB group bacterium]
MSKLERRGIKRAMVLARVLFAVAFAILSVGVEKALAQSSSLDGGSALVDVMGDGSVDSDEDGLTDAAEAALKTNPVKADSDDDTLPDAYEVMNGLDPLNFSDASADVDKDGLANFEEFEAGTLPAVADTDGDGYWDGIEMERGADPTLSESYPVRQHAADLNCDGVLDASDMQMVINGALGMPLPVPANVDANEGLGATDVQLVINAILHK